MAEPLLRLEATVTPDQKLSLTTHTDPNAGFAAAREALIQVREELDRIIRDGPTVCPFRHRTPQR